ncbi:hypothetical protein [uncultured Pontibacter sp.]|uniref:hypothetical protein n=1 Tax=uncultured Pontibacter sp. TaxID=453356 RepID=UPI0026080CEC|nr:hypothetical protein [uncultured Pontibacter sp.]
MMTEKSRQERISHLRQHQERKHFLGEFLLSLSQIVGKELTEESVLTLEETNTVINRIHYRDSQVPTFNFTFPSSQADSFREIFSCLIPEITNPKTYFTTSRIYRSFFLQMNCSFAIPNFEKIIELDTNTFYIFHKDLTNGLWVDYNEENWSENGKTEYVWTYELRVWGKEWVNKVHTAYNSRT